MKRQTPVITERASEMKPHSSDFIGPASFILLFYFPLAAVCTREHGALVGPPPPPPPILDAITTTNEINLT